MESKTKSWYSKILGRSFFYILFGNFFVKKNNSAGLVATLLVGTLCFVIIYKLVKTGQIDKEVELMANIVFVVIGYYFGAKQGKTQPDDDEE